MCYAQISHLLPSYVLRRGSGGRTQTHDLGRGEGGEGSAARARGGGRGRSGRGRGRRGRGRGRWAEGLYPIPWGLGCSLGPSPFASAIKCHQKSTCNSAGSSVGSLAPPRLGGAAVSAVSCQCFPCSFVLALRELGLRLGAKAPLPLRASSRRVLPGAGALAGYRTPIQLVCSTAKPWLQTRAMLQYTHCLGDLPMHPNF
jgi:hypothetical protein